MSVNRQAVAGPLSVVVLATDSGPDPQRTVALDRVGGATLLSHALRAAMALRPATVTVVTLDCANQVANEARSVVSDARIVRQAGPEDAGEAIRSALPDPDEAGRLLVLPGTMPLLQTSTLAKLVTAVQSDTQVAVLGFDSDLRSPCLRIIRDAAGGVGGILDPRHTGDGELAFSPCSAGVIALSAGTGHRWLGVPRGAAADPEVRFDGLVALARIDGGRVALETCSAAEALRVRSRRDLAAAERLFQERARALALESGVTLPVPESVILSWDTRIGQDVEIAPNVVIAPGVTLEDGVRIAPFSHLEGCTVRAGARIGPFARLRPGADIGHGAHVGNFVEVKNALLGTGAKANHLAYLGDAQVGAGANIGAGVVTCNYDGAVKHRTEIGEDAFVGTNSSLVAPVRIGAGAYVGSGSVITEDVPDDALAIGRARQVTLPGGAIRLRVRIAAGSRKQLA